jgi:CheY-like chemotaxis protein
VHTPLRILGVDNEPSVTLSLRYIFPGPRYEIETVENSEAALAIVDADPNRYDILIVDQIMPNLTGLELVRAARKHGFTGRIVVVAADLMPEARESFEELDVHTMLAKPFDIQKLRAAVEDLAA